MGDNKKWFKVWTSLLTNPEFDDMPNWCIGAWVKLGAMVALHGDNGNLSMSRKQFIKRTNIPEDTLAELGINLSKVNVNFKFDDNGTCFVSFLNWSKYQTDWNSYERLKKHRESQMITKRETVQDKKRREEIRRDKNKYKEYIFLTNEEYEKLKEHFGYALDEWLNRLNNYLGSKGVRYKSHYHTLLNWARREGWRPPEKPKPIEYAQPPQDRINKEELKELIKGIGKAI